MLSLFSVPVSITSKSQALALVLGWVKEWRTANPSEHSENSDSRKVRQSENQKSRLDPSDSLIFRDSDSSGSPSIPSFPKIVVTPNPEMIVAAQTDPEFLKALQSADLAIPDGIGIVWALKISNFKFKISNLSRLSGLDLMESLIREPQKVRPFELKVMLLGGRPGIAEKAAKILSENSENSDSRNVRPSESRKTGISGSQALRKSGSSGFPSFPSVLKIKAISGPKDIVHTSKSELDELINSINSFQPDLLFVAFGHGKQEKWLTKNRHRLNAGVAMGVGGAFDQIADPSLRPPAYINSIGLGWLYRLLREPRRWKRQLALVKFVEMVSIRALEH